MTKPAMHSVPGPGAERGGALGLLALAIGVLLPGCPLKDDYYVDEAMAQAGSDNPAGGATGASGEASNAGTSGASAGEAGSPMSGGRGGEAGAVTSQGGTNVGGGYAGSTGGDLGSCADGTCTATCCSGQCADLQTDPDHCGACTTVCPGGHSCASGACVTGWVDMSDPPSGFSAREQAAFVAFDNKLFIFGGLDASGQPLDTGAIYDPATDTWELVSVGTNLPSPRALATAVWTGARIVVFGGIDPKRNKELADGAIYDPATDSWSAMAPNSTGRGAAMGGATSSAAFFWGGWNAKGNALGGADRYDLGFNSWLPATESSSDPGAVLDAATAFTGQYLYVYGGRHSEGEDPVGTAARYALDTSSWSSVISPGLSARYGAFGIWDSLAFLVWGGRDLSAVRNDGQYLYNNVWLAMSVEGAPSPRSASQRETGWAFARGSGDILYIGGLDANGNALTNGGRYDAWTPKWTAIEDWPSGQEHRWAAAAQVAGEILIWGGRDGTAVTAKGERWLPD